MFCIGGKAMEFNLKHQFIWRGSTLNAGWVTTLNKHAVIKENRCTKIAKDIDPYEAALFGCAVTTGFGVIENNAKIKIGESVLIFVWRNRFKYDSGF